MGLASCTQEQEITGISLDVEKIELKSGETYQLIATVEPASMSGAVLTWTSNDSKVVTVDDEGVVTAVAAGTTTVEVASGAASDVCNVTVLPDFSMTISAVETGGNSVKAKAVPSDNETEYYIAIAYKSDYDSFGGNDGIFEHDRAAMESIAEENGQDLSDYVKSVILSGENEKLFEGLDPETDYVIYGYSLDAEMNFGDKVFTCEVKTGKPEALDFTIEISDIKYDGFTAAVTPSYSKIPFYQSCFTKQVYDELGGTDEALLERLKETFISNAALASISIEEYMAKVLVSGSQTVNVVKLIPQTSYYFAAMQFDENAEHFGKLVKEEVKTIEQDYIDFEAAVSIESSTQNTVTVNTSASDKDQRYCIEILSTEALDRFGETLDESVTNWWYFRTETGRLMDTPEHPLEQFVIDITQCGDLASFEFSDLESDQDYIVFTFAVDKYGIPISEISYAEVHTDERAFAIDMTFDVKYSYANPYMTANVTPSDNKQQYFFDIILAENIESIVDQPELVINWAMNYFFFSQRLATGAIERTVVVREKAYAVAFAYNSETGDVSEPYIYELNPEDF